MTATAERSPSMTLAMEIVRVISGFNGTIILAPYDANTLAFESDQSSHNRFGRICDFRDGDRFQLWGKPGIVSEHCTVGTAILCPVRI